jgi:glycosyltransferase involved in cell wall biosynthesis
MTVEPMNTPLRILAIVNLPWDPRLGAARVWIELTEEWTKVGHIVEKFCLTDAFPTPTSSRGLSALRQAIFPYRAAAYVRRNAQRFDIIDCLVGTLPFSKKSLRFHGLLVARSVGLHRLYDRFQRLSWERWPDQPKGRLLGGLFYRLWARYLRKNADEAIRRCDLLNLPNESELNELEENFRIHKPAIIQPYGLNDRHRKAFEQAMQPAELRLEKKKICFIGMWSLRKGARDWPEIIRRIWEKIPDARIAFLGTMFSEKEVFDELGMERLDRVECVPTYDPADLPALLGDCAVGLFPSYIEGFGLAVLEQLACGIPTVAYDVPGPRQILESHRAMLLTPEGDAGEMAERATQILQMSLRDYSELSAQCLLLAGKYRWSEIAAETMRRYREAFERLSQLIVFTHPFSLAAAGGGPRILRSLLKDAPVPNLCVCTAPSSRPLKHPGSELQLPMRPSLGRIERTRFNALAHAITPLFRPGFAKRLENIVVSSHACAIHSIAHGGLDFYDAYLLSKKLRIPFFLQVHDDVAYTGADRVPPKCVAEAWQGAASCFVISSELGAEYTKRYGKREFVIVTDGLDRVRASTRAGMNGLRIYFMGLFHIGYENNLEALIKAIDLLLPNETATRNCSITLRCDYIRPAVFRQSSLLRVLPFGSEADVQADLANADCLYLPLHFGEADRPFGAYSLSTKMVTYLGSGIPILYHGPAGTAAYNMLKKHRAAALATSLNPKHIADVLAELLQNDIANELAENALSLARRCFLGSEQHTKFWQEVLPFLSPRSTVCHERAPGLP